MKKKKFSTKLKLQKISVANLSQIEGGRRDVNNSKFTLCNDPTAQTFCYICYPTMNDKLEF